MHNVAHMTPHQRSIVLRVLLSRMRHDGCGGRPARAELMTGIEFASSGPKEALPMIVAGKFGPSRERTNANLIDVTAIMGDYDNRAVTPAEAAEKLRAANVGSPAQRCVRSRR